MSVQPWSGTYAVMLCPFQEDFGIDKAGLRTYSQQLALVDGLAGVVCNAFPGEAPSLQRTECAQVTQIVAEEVGNRLKVVAGVRAESTEAAVDHALVAREAGAHAILLTPMRDWLHTGRSKQDAMDYVAAVADNVDMPIVIDQPPVWTKACYFLDELITLASIPQVVAIRMSLGRSFLDSEQIRQSASHLSILSSHDAFLCEALLAGADGAMVSLAGLLPEPVVSLVNAAAQGDVAKARGLQEYISTLAQTLGLFNDDARICCQRLKAALVLLNRLPAATVRPPLLPLSEQEIEHMRLGMDTYRSRLRIDPELLPI
jgi:4-hydroxy-tetrahydrodipicolinate synthase